MKYICRDLFRCGDIFAETNFLRLNLTLALTLHRTRPAMICFIRHYRYLPARPVSTWDISMACSAALPENSPWRAQTTARAGYASPRAIAKPPKWPLGQTPAMA